MSMTNTFEQAVLNYIFRNTAISGLSTNLHVGLFTSAPGEDGGGTEASGNGYARVAVSRASGSWTNTNPTENTGAIAFPESTGSWGTVTHVGIFDSATSGNLLYYAALGTSRAVDAAGITITIPAGDLTVSQD